MDAVAVLVAIALLAPCATSSIAAGPLGPRPVAGWPRVFGSGIYGEVGVADLDADGRDELAVGSRDGVVVVLDGRGRPLDGWPQRTPGPVIQAPRFADLDEDGTPEIVVASHDGSVHAWRAGGDVVPGWPVDLRAIPASRPVVVPPTSGSPTMIAIAGADGRLHLLGPDGRLRPGWPREVMTRYAETQDLHTVAIGDLDGDGRPEILHLGGQEAVLQAWNLAGIPVAGFPRRLDDPVAGLAVDDPIRTARIACATRRKLVVLDVAGRVLSRRALTAEDRFTSAPAFIPDPASPDGPRLVAAATQAGTVVLVDDSGADVAGWPLRLGGFIYGLQGAAERFAILAPPLAHDVDGDGALELLVASYDQHLYGFELDGSSVAGWPLALGDALRTSPSFAQLDGEGPLEMMVPQGGETLFAFHVGGPVTTAPFAGARALAVSPQSGWRQVGVAVLIVLLTWLAVHLVRSSLADRGRPVTRLLLALAALLLLARIVLVVDGLGRQIRSRAHLDGAERQLAAALAVEINSTQRRAVTLAAALDSSLSVPSSDPLRLLYHLERHSDHERLDPELTGLAVTGPTGEVLQATGLLRGWTRRGDIIPTEAPPPGLRLLGDMPVLVGEAPVAGPSSGRRLILAESLLGDLPHMLAATSDASVQVRLDDRVLAWAGRPPTPVLQAWPWLGIVESARIVTLTDGTPANRLTVRLADERVPRVAVGWLDLALVIVVAGACVLAVSQRRDSALPRHPAGLALGTVVLYLGGWFLLSGGRLQAYFVSPAGHALEVLLHLAGLSATAALLAFIVGRRGRRLDLALLGSYLLVALLPLVLVSVIATRLLQRAQQEVMQDAVARFEQRADHLAQAYLGGMKFHGDLNRRARELLGQPPESGFFDFVTEHQTLFTYDLPTAYLTIGVQDRDDPTRHFTGFSWRAPRSAKLFSPRPAWTPDDEVLRGLFLDHGRPIVRAVHTLRTPAIEARLTAHLPLDQAVLAELESRLRILPFLPLVHLEPAWLTATARSDLSAGRQLPFFTRLAHPARDWRTGKPRWVVYHARAFLPAGKETATVLLAVLALVILPLGLSVWGAFGTWRRTVLPLNSLLAGIQRVAEGDLDVRLGGHGQSEVARASRSFDRMTESLRTTVQEMAEKKKLEEVSALKSRFLSMIGHDIKTPLAAITGAAENVLDGLAGPVSERQQRYLKMILDSGGNLQRLVADLLDLTRLESGRLQLQYETVDLGREIGEMLQTLQPLLEERDLRTEVTRDAAVSRVSADRTRLWQVLGNVLGNAIRHSPTGGKIRISVESVDARGRPNEVRTTVSDQGPGIPAAARARIFEPFYTGTTPGQSAGQGLGLAIVRQLVELHGGSVALADAAGGGTSLSFTLPAAAPTLHTDRVDPARSANPGETEGDGNGDTGTT